MGIFSADDPSNSESLFRTQADVGFNSFQNPIPTLNMGGQGWGISRDQMTPSYSAPFRPQSQEQAINSTRQGFFKSVNNQLNPFASTGYGRFADPFWGQQQYRESIFGRPADAGMWTAQNIGVGAGSFVAANAMTPGWAMKGANIGSRFGLGAANGMLGGFATGTRMGAAAAGGMGMAGAAGGAIFGGLIAPMAIAQGMVAAADYAVFDPYTLKRQTARDLRENFSGTTFGGGEGGNPYTGRGLSFTQSSKISSRMTKDSFKEFGLSGQEMRGISDMAARAGLMDNVNPEQFAKQFNQISKQVAVIAAIAKDPNFRNSVETIAKLKDAGMSIKGASSVIGQMSGSSSIAGVSLSKMMDLSTQGQFMYGANNITPYLGRMDYAQSYASFASAKRNGLVSDALMARMGGVEGATQSAVSASINASQTPFNRVMMANQYMFGQGNNGSVAQNLSAFGSKFAGSPTEAMGAMGLYGGAMTSAQLKERGPLAVQDQLMKIAKTANMVKKDGTVSDANSYNILTGTMGMDHKSAEAYVIQMLTAKSKDNLNNQLASATSDYRTNMATMMENEGAAMPIWAINAKRGVQKFGRGIKGISNSVTDIFTDPMARAADKLGLTVDELKFGQKTGELIRGKDLFNNNNDIFDRNEYNTFNPYSSGVAGDKGNKGASSEVKKAYETINEMSKAGNKEASNFLKNRDAASGKALADSSPGAKALINEVGLHNLVDAGIHGESKKESVLSKAKDDWLHTAFRTGKTEKEAMMSTAATDYIDNLTSNKVTGSDYLKAVNYKGDSTEDIDGARASDLLKGVNKSRGLKVFSRQINELNDIAKKESKDLNKLIDERGGLKKAIASVTTDKDSALTDELKPNERTEASGEETIKKRQELIEGHKIVIKRANDMFSQNKISGGEYLAIINKTTGEKMVTAADKFDEAVDKFVGKVDASNKSTLTNAWEAIAGKKEEPKKTEKLNETKQ